MINTLVSTDSMSRSDWLKWRQRGIGGSDASVICGINRYKSVVELFMEKSGQIEAQEAGETAYWGNIMEPIVRNEFTIRTGMEVEPCKYILQHHKFPFMFANLDGLINDSAKGSQFIFEAKTASAYNAHEWELDIPESYQLQVQHYMAVTGLSGAYVAVLIGGNHFKHFYIERDEELIELIIKLESIFWNCVLTNTPPKIDGSKACTDLINRLHPTGGNKDVIDLPNEALELIGQFEKAQEQESEILTLKDEASNKLKNMLGDHELGVIEGRIVSWVNVTSERLDAKTLKSEKPEIYSRYSKKSSSRRFGIK